jgi:hypothetical protein
LIWQAHREQGQYGAGYAIYYKRIERGTFQFPADGDAKALAIDSAALMRLLSGLKIAPAGSARG